MGSVIDSITEPRSFRLSRKGSESPPPPPPPLPSLPPPLPKAQRSVSFGVEREVTSAFMPIKTAQPPVRGRSLPRIQALYEDSLVPMSDTSSISLGSDLFEEEYNRLATIKKMVDDIELEEAAAAAAKEAARSSLPKASQLTSHLSKRREDPAGWVSSQVLPVPPKVSRSSSKSHQSIESQVEDDLFFPLSSRYAGRRSDPPQEVTPKYQKIVPSSDPAPVEVPPADAGIVDTKEKPKLNNTRIANLFHARQVHRSFGASSVQVIPELKSINHKSPKLNLSTIPSFATDDAINNQENVPLQPQEVHKRKYRPSWMNVRKPQKVLQPPLRVKQEKSQNIHKIITNLSPPRWVFAKKQDENGRSKQPAYIKENLSDAATPISDDDFDSGHGHHWTASKQPILRPTSMRRAKSLGPHNVIRVRQLKHEDMEWPDDEVDFR
jgi:hypothetical protein